MNFLDRIPIYWKAAKAVISRRKVPLITVLHITYRCNLSCRYCGYHERKTGELGTDKLLSLIDEFYRLGTRFIVISGGEPLLRDDLGQVIKSCKNKRMFVSMNSNGIFVKQRIGEIKSIDRLKLSLDGPKEINDRVKGEGTYDKVIEAIEACKRENLKVSLTTVISKYNVFSAHLAHILDIAKEYNIEVSFQPADQTHCGNIGKDISSDLPAAAAFREAVSFLIKEKSKGNNRIINSLAGLRHLYHWPCPRKIPCLVSLFSTFLSPDGKIFICDMFPGSQNYLVTAGQNLKITLDNLQLPCSCQHCWSASTIDFNLLLGPRLSRILESRNGL
ncbi:MAG: radical SAM protein [Candidatus Omnitrophica bacterium]|nr:radical SAM protein [Candidatus Omnitrophota bacterium]